MIENLSLPDNFILKAGGINLLPHCSSCEIKRAAVGDGGPLFVQGIINLSSVPKSLPKVADEVVTSIPFARSLVVQSATEQQITIGCTLSIHNASQSGETDVSPNSKVVGEVVGKLLTAAGVGSYSFNSDKKLQRTINVQPGQSYVGLAAEIAAAFGWQLYVHDGVVTSVKRSFKGQPSMAELDKSELLDYKREPGIALPAQKLVCKGTLSKLKSERKNLEQRTKTQVTGGVRTVTRKIEFSRNSTTETTTVIEPLASISAFVAIYTSAKDPEDAVQRAKSLPRSSVMSEKTTIVSEYDRDGFITKRTTTTIAVGCKALSGFYSAWASAVSSNPDANLMKPTRLLASAVTSFQVEKWSYDLPRAQPPVKSATSEVHFRQPSGSASYRRELYLTLGQLVPELGSPIAGFQKYSKGKSRPVYTNPFQQVLAEVEEINWELQDNGSWATQRTLKQAQGLLDASIPQNAMESFSFPKGNDKASTFNKKWIAISSASTLVDAASETSHSGSAPSAEVISTTEEYELTRDYALEIKLTSTRSLLPRTVTFSPSEYASSIRDIGDAVMFRAQQLIGVSEKCTVTVPLRAAVASELKPLSLFTIGQDKYLLNDISCKIDTSGARVSFSGYAIH